MVNTFGILCYVTIATGLCLVCCEGQISVDPASRPWQNNTDRSQGLGSLVGRTFWRNNDLITGSNSTNKTERDRRLPFGMSKSAWTFTDNTNDTNRTDSQNSVPISFKAENVTAPILNISNFNPLGIINNLTGSAAIIRSIQAGYAKLDKSESLKSLLGDDNKPVNSSDLPIRTLSSRFGVYIPMEKLQRLKRQTSETKAPQGRIYMLMNPSSNETAISSTIFDKGVLMLVKQNTSSFDIENRIRNISSQLPKSELPKAVSIENNTNIGEILQSYKTFQPISQSTELREVLQSQPAIQRINDLNNIELAFPADKGSDNSSTFASEPNITLTNNQLRRLLEVLLEQTKRSDNSRTVTVPNISSFINPITNDIPVSRSIDNSLQNDNTNTQLNSINNNTSSSSTRRSGTVRGNMDRSSSSGSSSSSSASSSSRSSTSHIPSTPRENTRDNTLVSFRESARPRFNVSSRRPPTANRRASSGSDLVQLRRTLPRGAGILRVQGSSQRGASLGSRTSPVQPRLTNQSPATVRRITGRGATSRIGTSRTGSGRRTVPLVRTISSNNLRQQTAGRQTVRPVRTGTQRRSRPQRARTPTRRPARRIITRRRRPAPADPFTSRFSAGFQRGSVLLNQMPLNNTGFDGSRAGPIGFNTLNLGGPSPFGPPPPGFPGFPPMFGGGAGMFLGPTII